MAKALDIVLEDTGGGLMELDYVVEGGVVHIGTREKLSKRVVRRVYNVRDLLYWQSDPSVPMAVVAKECGCDRCTVTLRFARTWGTTPDCSVNPRLSGADTKLLLTRTSRRITRFVARDSWYPNGPAIFTEFDGMFVISQTYPEAQELREFLANLRYTRKQPVPLGEGQPAGGDGCDGSLLHWPTALRPVSSLQLPFLLA